MLHKLLTAGAEEQGTEIHTNYTTEMRESNRNCIFIGVWLSSRGLCSTSRAPTRVRVNARTNVNAHSTTVVRLHGQERRPFLPVESVAPRSLVS